MILPQLENFPQFSENQEIVLACKFYKRYPKMNKSLENVLACKKNSVCPDCVFFFMRNWGMRKVFEKLRFLRFYQGLQKKKCIFCGFSFRFKMCITAFWSEKSQIRRTIRRSMHTKKKMLFREQESKNNGFQNRLFSLFLSVTQFSR